jgi:predicted nucleotidyltransferase
MKKRRRGRVGAREAGITKVRVHVPNNRISDFCQKWSVQELALFGSVLRRDFYPHSDIDVLVSFDPQVQYSLFDIVHMQQELTHIFGRTVDLVEKESIEQSENYVRKRNILSSTEVIYKVDQE